MPPRLLASVLDRLLEDVEFDDASGGLEPMKRAVRRDLEWLLNTKRTAVGLPDDLGHADRSLLTYGLPDFTAASLSNPDHQAQLRRAIQDAVARFEPRLTHVSVVLVDAVGSERMLRFQISAMLRAEPEPVPVTFDSMLELGSRAFRVDGG